MLTHRPVYTYIQTFQDVRNSYIDLPFGILIDINTKRIVTTAVAAGTAVTYPEQDTSANSTAVTSVENTARAI